MSSAPPPIEPTAPPAELPATGDYLPNQDDRTTGMLCHLVGILAGILGAIIMHLCMTNKSPFVAHHTKESLNFQITLFIIEIAFLIISGIVAVLTAGLSIFFSIPIFLLIYVAFLIFEVMACISANKGEWHNYPFSFRFVK